MAGASKNGAPELFGKTMRARLESPVRDNKIPATPTSLDKNPFRPSSTHISLICTWLGPAHRKFFDSSVGKIYFTLDFKSMAFVIL